MMGNRKADIVQYIMGYRNQKYSSLISQKWKSERMQFLSRDYGVLRGLRTKILKREELLDSLMKWQRDFKCSSFTSLLASSDAGGAWKSGMFIDYVSGLPLFWHFGFKSIFIHLKVFHLVHVLRCLIWLSFIYFFVFFSYYFSLFFIIIIIIPSS